MDKVKIVLFTAMVIFLAGCIKKENPTPHINLFIAALQGNVDEIQKHIKAGSDLNEKDEYGSSPLIIAITFNKIEAAKALIEAGADLSVSNNEGSTPLHIAAFLCHIDMVEALLAKGADKNIKNFSGSTALGTVEGPFDNVKDIYDSIRKSLSPLGLRLDYEQIQISRPKIAEMLR